MRALVRWRAGLLTLALLFAAIAGSQWWRYDDFQPFAMTIEEWTAARAVFATGAVPSTTTMRLEYQRRGEWTMSLVGDTFSPSQIGEVTDCHDGTYTRFDARGSLTGRTADPGMCVSPMRWIAFGYRSDCPWQRTVDDGRITCTDGRERVVFDASNGLPLLYQVSSPDGVVEQQMIFRLERYGSTSRYWQPSRPQGVDARLLRERAHVPDRSHEPGERAPQ